MRELRKLLYRFGIYKTQEGYDPLLVAVELILENFELLGSLTKWLPSVKARPAPWNATFAFASHEPGRPIRRYSPSLPSVPFPSPLPPATSCACYTTTWMTSCLSGADPNKLHAASQADAWEAAQLSKHHRTNFLRRIFPSRPCFSGSPRNQTLFDLARS